MSKNPQNDINEIAKKARNLKGKSKNIVLRKTAQETLLYLGKLISKHNERYYTSNDPNEGVHEKTPAVGLLNYVDTKRATRPPGAEPLGWKSGYRNIIPIEKGKKSDGVSSLIGLGSPLTKFFTFELTSQQQALLYPKIRLFKVEYELDSSGKVKLPFEETAKKEIIFEKAITTNELAVLTDQGGNIGSSGIESFEWALKGINPAEVDSNIEASLKIYFNNIGVFKQRIDAIATQTNLSTAPAHFMDLITFAPPITKTTSQLPCIEDYQPYFFEVLAEVGWSVADMGNKDTFTDKQIEYINNQTVKLYLTLADHKFDFKEDGSATLTANYRARHNMSSRGYDVLHPTDEYSTRLQTQNQSIRDTTKNIDDAAEGEDTVDQVAKQTSLTKERDTFLKDNYKILIDSLLQSSYEATIPNALLLNGIIPEREVYGLMSFNDLSEGTLTYKNLFRLLDLADKAIIYDEGTTVTKGEIHRALDSVLSAIKTKDANIKIVRTTRYLRKGMIIESGPDLGPVGPSPARSTARRSNVSTAASRVLSDDLGFVSDVHKTSPSGTTKIEFLYLGDILETLFETQSITEDIKGKKIAFVTTDVEYEDIMGFIQETFDADKNGATEGTILNSFDISKIRCSEGTSPIKKETINLANIPIELGSFLDFFTEKVISQNRQNYYLNDFLNDLFTSFLKPLLGNNSILGIPNTPPLIVNVDISAVETNNNEFFDSVNPAIWLGLDRPRTPVQYPKDAYKINYPKSDAPDNTEYVFISSIIEYQGQVTENPVFKQNPSDKGTNNTATVKVFGVSTTGTGLGGSYSENAKQQIPSFVVGLDRGVLKAVSFERVDQPYLRESRVATDKSFGLGQLRELYHVNLTLYGNNILKPGQTIYVEPNSLIFGRPSDKKSVSRILGLGGYHLVVDVENSISADGWETKVKALHMAMPALKS